MVLFTLLKSLMTTDEKASRKLAPLHPGEVLRGEYMEPLGLSADCANSRASMNYSQTSMRKIEETG